MNKKNLECLKKARDLLTKGWCQKWAADDDGKDAYVENATKFCAFGALYYATGHEYHELYDILCNELEGRNLIKWNDEKDRTQQEVVNFFNKIIEKFEGELKDESYN